MTAPSNRINKDTIIMNRRNFIKSVGSEAVTVPFLAQSKEVFEMPEIRPGTIPRDTIFILSDDHRYDFMGFMGKPEFLETPNMDRIAKEGANIENAFVTTSLCSPSHATILTGMKRTVEPGIFKVYLGGNSQDVMADKFEVIE